MWELERRTIGNKPKLSNLVESKYQFYNRSRQDSVFSISERNYHILKKAKSIPFINQRTGDRIFIRAAKESRSFSRTNSNSKDQDLLVWPKNNLIDREESH